MIHQVTAHRSTRATLLAACMLAPGLAGAATWSPTATRSIDLASIAGGSDLGAVPASQPLTIRVGMQMRNQAALASAVAAQASPASPTYGQFLTPKAFNRYYAPSAARISAVVDYLSSQGFTNITVEPNGLLVSADGTAAIAQAAFNTRLEQVLVGGKTLFINLTGAQVPAALSGDVVGVLGLNTVGRLASPIALPTPPTLIASYTPQQFRKIYGASGVPFANKASIAIMAEGDMTGVVADLRTAEAAFALAQVPVSIVQVGLPSPDVTGADEWDLDTQTSSGIAGNLKTLYIYTTTSLSDSDLALEFSRWVTDDKAKAASASLGECEAFPYVDGSMAIDDEIFLQAAAQGQSFFASAGDTGSFCPLGPAGANGVPAGAPLVSYPASSPYVVGVGGTTLVTYAGGAYDTEITWYAGGGGISQFEGSPFWQASKVTVLGTGNLRGVPDVAMDADPDTGALVYVNGASEGVGGTSLSSPLALGIWARAIAQNPKLGAAGPAYYGLYDSTTTPASYPSGGFHDITVGTNGLYTALPGYDLTTGLGTFNIGQLVTALHP